MLFNSLSGRFLGLTIVFVMVAEVLILLPSTARFRADYLQERLERAQIASLALLATPNDMVAPELESELLDNAGVINIVLRRNFVRELVLATPMPGPVDATYDMRNATVVSLITDMFATIGARTDRVIRIIGNPVQGGGTAIEITMSEAPLREALIDYGFRILLLSLFISVVTAALLFLAVRRFIVRPMRRVVENMTHFRDDPEDPRRIMKPKSSILELKGAEVALNEMQTSLVSALKQKDRLASLGSAVAKVSHDLRNMLSVAQLVADRLEISQDPAVKRVAPKLVSNITRAVNLCESTLAYGKAEEPQPEKRPLALYALIADVLEAELAHGDDKVALRNEVPPELQISADPEQLYRVFANLIRNARQAMENSAEGGAVTVSAIPVTGEESGCEITIHDTGPGLPTKAVEYLFKPFQGSSRRGGTGLGLAIAAELVRGHGGALELLETSSQGTTFVIRLPDCLLPPAPLASISALQTG
ncbi:MAG: HAMP domain-containing sensor histidine kinase [Pseudomonadota bacterium]